MSLRCFLMLALVLPLFLAGDVSAVEVHGGTRHGVQVGEHPGFVIAPPKPGPEGKRPWVWYAPVLGNNPSPNIGWMAKQLLERGYYLVGCNVGESMGNPAGRKIFSQFYDQIVAEFKLEPKARLLPQSRGGLMLYNWAVENPEKVRCIAGIYAVGDLRSYPRLPKAAEAYGMTVEELEKNLAQHNPIDRLEPLAKAGVPLLAIHGDVDKAVPLEKNAQVVHDRYRALGGRMEIILIKGKGHEAVPEYFQNQEFLDFLMNGGFAEAKK